MVVILSARSRLHLPTEPRSPGRAGADPGLIRHSLVGVRLVATRGDGRTPVLRGVRASEPVGPRAGPRARTYCNLLAAASRSQLCCPAMGSRDRGSVRVVTLVSVVVLTIGSVLAGCAAPSEPSGSTSGSGASGSTRAEGRDSMVVADPYEDETLNPLMGYGEGGASKIYEGLVTYDAERAPRPLPGIRVADRFCRRPHLDREAAVGRALPRRLRPGRRRRGRDVHRVARPRPGQHGARASTR